MLKASCQLLWGSCLKPDWGPVWLPQSFSTFPLKEAEAKQESSSFGSEDIAIIFPKQIERRNCLGFEFLVAFS